jgi:hypothetical protein
MDDEMELGDVVGGIWAVLKRAPATEWTYEPETEG